MFEYSCISCITVEHTAIYKHIHLFERFYTSGKSGSTGLGLALVKSIAGFYNNGLQYRFNKGMHEFEVRFVK